MSITCLQVSEPITQRPQIIPFMGMITPSLGMPRNMGSTIESATSASMAGALFTTTQQRVLGYLFGQPERSFFGNELIALAGVGSGSVQRELKRLTEAGLVNTWKIGNQKHFQANSQSPIYQELCAITQKTFGLAGPLWDALKPLESAIDTAFIFGSIAKGKDTAQSDIDLMIVSETLSYADVMLALDHVQSLLSRPINPTIYKKPELQKRIREGHSFITRVLVQPKIWLKGSDADLST